MSIPANFVKFPLCSVFRNCVKKSKSKLFEGKYLLNLVGYEKEME